MGKENSEPDFYALGIGEKGPIPFWDKIGDISQ